MFLSIITASDKFIVAILGLAFPTNAIHHWQMSMRMIPVRCSPFAARNGYKWRGVIAKSINRHLLIIVKNNYLAYCVLRFTLSLILSIIYWLVSWQGWITIAANPRFQSVHGLTRYWAIGRVLIPRWRSSFRRCGGAAAATNFSAVMVVGVRSSIRRQPPGRQLKIIWDAIVFL